MIIYLFNTIINDVDIQAYMPASIYLNASNPKCLKVKNKQKNFKVQRIYVKCIYDSVITNIYMKYLIYFVHSI